MTSTDGLLMHATSARSILSDLAKSNRKPVLYPRR